MKVVVEPLVVAVKTVTTVNMTSLIMDLSAVIQHGMNMVLTVPRLNQTIVGIVLVVHVLVMILLMMAVAMMVAMMVVLLVTV